MKILFDHQIYNDKNYGGISRYFYELSKGLTSFGIDVENTIRFSENEFIKDSSYFNASEFISFQFKGRGRIKKYLNQKISERIIKNGNFDIFHPTYYDTYFIKSELNKRPLVVTFHDLIHEKFSDRFPKTLTNINNVIADRKMLLSMASKVIAVSHHTKKDIIDYYHVDERKIEVIHLANSLSPTNLTKDTSLGNFILFVGVRESYKNFTTFLKAVSSLLVKERTLKVISAGGGRFTDDETKLIKDLNIDGQVIQISINDNILSQLYYNAVLFIFPSLYEGFGIPVLEAFSCGCPSILSNTSSLPEVGGDAALYVNPEDESDILNKVEQLYYNSDLREDYRQRGFFQVKKFSWHETSKKTLEVYQSVI